MSTALGRLVPRRQRSVITHGVAGHAVGLAHGRRQLITVFLLPGLLFYIFFYILPVIASVWIGFTNWSGLGSDMRFIGLANYQGILHDPVYWLAFRNTMQVLFVVGISVFLVSFVFMTVLREARGSKFIRAVIFFPNVVAPVALGIAWGFLLNPQTGLVNYTLAAVGLGRFQQVWLGPQLILKSIMVALVWIYVGFFATILLSAADRIPSSYYEAVELEGASAFQTFRLVTLPMTWDVLSVAAVLWVITAMKIFEFIYAFGATSGAPPTSVWTTGIYMYMVTLGNRSPIYKLGYGSAIAVTMVILTAVLVLLVGRLLRRERIEF